MTNGLKLSNGPTDSAVISSPECSAGVRFGYEVCVNSPVDFTQIHPVDIHFGKLFNPSSRLFSRNLLQVEESLSVPIVYPPNGPRAAMIDKSKKKNKPSTSIDEMLDHAHYVLSDDDWDAFNDALERPRKNLEALKRTLKAKKATG